MTGARGLADVAPREELRAATAPRVASFPRGVLMGPSEFVTEGASGPSIHVTGFTEPGIDRWQRGIPPCPA